MIGLDLIAIDRIARLVDRHGEAALKRFLNPEEIANTKAIESIAGLWAAKEAVAKALGCGIGSRLGFHDITICKDAQGAPTAFLSDKAATLHGVKSLAISITHEKTHAAAVALKAAS
jgi:holo-[acyl-carrier protein] synthase